MQHRLSGHLPMNGRMTGAKGKSRPRQPSNILRPARSCGSVSRMILHDRDLSHGARVLLVCLARARSRHVRGHTVHYAGRPWLANRTKRTCRQVSRYTAELEKAGRLVKVKPRRYYDPEIGWCTDGVQGYVIIRIVAARANVTSTSAPLLRRVRAALTGRRGRPTGVPQPPPVADVLARMRGTEPPAAPARARPGVKYCCPLCGGPHALAGHETFR